MDQTNATNEILERIRHAFRLYCRLERAEGRKQLTQIWEELGPEGDIFHRCVAAHYLADTEDDPDEELKWDQRALEIADSLPDELTATYPSAAAVRAFLPSLHLNLAEDYRKMGDWPRARYHTDRGVEACDGLRLDSYGRTVRAGLIRVDTQIEDRDRGPSMIFDFD